MMKREERARANFLAGRNCAQSVAMAFADVMGVTEEQAALLSAGFGGGMGRLRQNCGALSAAIMLCGALSGPQGADSAKRGEVYARVQRVYRLFQERFGHTQCYALLGLPPGASDPEPAPRTQAYYASRPCLRIVGEAARMLEEVWLESQEDAPCGP